MKRLLLLGLALSAAAAPATAQRRQPTPPPAAPLTVLADLEVRTVKPFAERPPTPFLKDATGSHLD
jgi:hypothetical protein